MTRTLEVLVHADYLAPFCWPAAVHLRQLAADFPQIRVVRKAFLTVPDDAARPFTEDDLRRRATAASVTSLAFRIPKAGDPAPRGSARALEAARWVAENHFDRFDEFDLALYTAYFQGAMDVSNPSLLAMLATRIGLDGTALAAALQARTYLPAITSEHREAVRMGVTMPPAVFIGTTQLSGPAPYADYAAVVSEELARRSRRKSARIPVPEAPPASLRG